MSRSPKNPLRPLLEEERQQLIRLSRGQAIAASQVARAKAVLAVRMATTTPMPHGRRVANRAMRWSPWWRASILKVWRR